VSRPAEAKARSPHSSTFRPWWFLTITFGWTWAFWWSAVWSGRAWSDPLVFALFALGGVGPLLSAVVLLRATSSREAQLDFWRRLLDVRRLRFRWWVLVVVVALLPAVLGRSVTGGDGAWLAPGAGLVLVTAVVAGVLEEPGWRGYLLDALGTRHGVVVAAAVVGVFWALWHLPLFFLAGSYQHALGLGTSEFWLFMLTLLCLSFVYAAVFYAAGRSILAVVILHAAANAAGELISAPDARVAETVVVLAMTAVSVVLLVRRNQDVSTGRPARAGGPPRRGRGAKRVGPNTEP
jgi:uncharacterized protein